MQTAKAKVPQAVTAPVTARAMDSTLQKSSQIATLPAVALQIIQLCEDPTSAAEELNKVILHDPVLGVRILKLVNSAYYGVPERVHSLKQAIVLLGLRAVKNVAIAATLVKMIRRGRIGTQFDARDLWKHCVAVATASQMIARQTGFVSPDEAFLAGLIHDVGIVVEMQVYRDEFTRMVTRIENDPQLSFRAAEESFLGISHEAYGAELCRVWNLPCELQLVAGYHHRPWELAGPQSLLPTVIHVADVVAARSGLGYTRTVETDVINDMLLDELKLVPLDIKRIEWNLPEATQNSLGFLSHTT